MPTRPAQRTLIHRLVMAHAAAISCSGPVTAVDTSTPDNGMIDIVAQLADGMKNTYDQPRVVLWLEDTNHHFIRTLYRFGKKNPKHYEDLPVSFALSNKAEKPADLDAVTGATVIWGSKGHIQLPARWHGLDLLSGKYVLRIESAKDRAKHFADFTVPLNRKAMVKPILDKGYVTSLAITVAPAGTPVSVEPIMIPDPAGIPHPLPAGDVETAKASGTVVSVTPAPKPNQMPSFTLRLDGSGDVVEYRPRKDKPESAEIIAKILASKVGERKNIVYTEAGGGRAMVIENAPHLP